jgi:hypothetical protein
MAATADSMPVNSVCREYQVSKLKAVADDFCAKHLPLATKNWVTAVFFFCSPGMCIQQLHGRICQYTAAQSKQRQCPNADFREPGNVPGVCPQRRCKHCCQ